MFIKGVCYNENDEIITEGNQTLYQVVDESGNEFLQFLSNDTMVTVDVAEEKSCQNNSSNYPSTSSSNVGVSGENSKNLSSEGLTRALLDLYTQNFTEVGPYKKFKTLKMMWEHIATEMSNNYKTVCTGYQCENRLKRVKRDAKEALDNNRTSGRAPRVVKYQDELQKISSIDDSFLPKVRFGVGIADIDEPATSKRKPCDSDTTSDEEVDVSKKKKRKTAKRSTTSAIDVIQELAKQREINKMKRHKEKLEFMRDVFCRKQTFDQEK